MRLDCGSVNGSIYYCEQLLFVPHVLLSLIDIYFCILCFRARAGLCAAKLNVILSGPLRRFVKWLF